MAAPKKKTKEPGDIAPNLSKMERMMALLEEEKKLASKAGDSLKIGKLEDFSDTGRGNYKLTNILGIDLNICGWKKASFNVVYGAESSGKSTSVMAAIEGIQMSEPEAVILYWDAEQTVSDIFLDRFPYLNKGNIIFLKEQIIEFGFNKVLEYAKVGAFDYLVIDSVDTLISKKEVEKNLEDAVMMEKARVLSRSLAELQGYMAQFNITTIMLQQLRLQFSSFTSYEGRSGGNSMKFYPSSVLKVSNLKAENILDADGNVVTRYVKIKNEKSKVSRPYMETFTYINTDTNVKVAIDRLKETLDYALEYGIFEAGGAGWITITTPDGELKKVQGKEKALRFFKESVDMYTAAKMQIYAAGLPPEMFIVKFDEIKKMLEKENILMKENKKNILTLSNKIHLISEEDKTPYIFGEKDIPELYLDEETFKIASFNLLPYDEQQKIKEENEKKIIEEEKNTNEIIIIKEENE